MSFRFKIKEPPANGVRRIALDQIEAVETQLRGTGDPHLAVHAARRGLKRLRSLLKLIRPALPDDVYRREAKRLADTGRLLSGQRDRHVMRQTLRHLESTYGALPDNALDSLESLLREGEGKTGDKASATSADPHKKAAAKLSAARKFFAGRAVEAVTLASLFQGVETVYRRARRMHRHCLRGDASDEDFHTWRKAVQQHWRHMQLLSRAWPDALSARASEAKTLSQMLGEDHDLSVLGAFARAQARHLPPAGLAALEAQVREAQERLRQLAMLHGDRLFTERADDLIERLTAYWTAALSLAQAAESSLAVVPPREPAPEPDPAPVAAAAGPPAPSLPGGETKEHKPEAAVRRPRRQRSASAA